MKIAIELQDGQIVIDLSTVFIIKRCTEKLPTGVEFQSLTLVFHNRHELVFNTSPEKTKFTISLMLMDYIQYTYTAEEAASITKQRVQK
jgi:hypothetical protein